MTDNSPFQRPPTRAVFQFDLKRLLLITLLIACIATVLGGLIRSDLDFAQKKVYLFLAIGGPLAVVVIVGLVRAAIRWYRHEFRDDD
jgi:hypothetical protein